MKKYQVIGMISLVLLTLFTGCSNNNAQATKEKTVKPVAVMEIKEETCPILLHYTGTIEPQEIKTYAFKADGKIAEMLVEEGQMVQKGDKLAGLEQDNSRLAELNVDKAQANYDFVVDYFEKIEELQAGGAISPQDMQEADLEKEQAEYSLEQAQKNLELTRSAMIITADTDGYVISVVSQENEVVAAGYPVVVLGSNDYKGRIGLIEEDLARVKTGAEVDVLIGNEEVKGIITAVNKSPDEESRTYMADISLNNTMPENTGAIIKVTIAAGTEKGIWIPIKYILNDGEDYVLVAENGRASRRNIKLCSMLGETVRVEGLKTGEQLITEGIKSVKDGYEIAVHNSISGSTE